MNSADLAAELAGLALEGPTGAQLRIGVVTATAPLTVTIGAGSAVANVRRLASYAAPAVSDVVAIIVDNARVLVLGKIT